MGEALNKDILNLDLSKCERRVIHPETGMEVGVSTLSIEQLAILDEDSFFNEGIQELIDAGKLEVEDLIRTSKT